MCGDMDMSPHVLKMLKCDFNYQKYFNMLNYVFFGTHGSKQLWEVLPENDL